MTAVYDYAKDQFGDDLLRVKYIGRIGEVEYYTPVFAHRMVIGMPVIYAVRAKSVSMLEGDEIWRVDKILHSKPNRS